MQKEKFITLLFAETFYLFEDLTAPSFPCWGEGNTILSGLNLNNASKTSHPTKYIYHYTLKCDSFFSRSIIYVFNLLTAIIPHFFFFYYYFYNTVVYNTLSSKHLFTALLQLKCSSLPLWLLNYIVLIQNIFPICSHSFEF